MKKKKIAFILGIRPDIIRASLILEHLKDEKEIETVFIWSGQHYSDNLKDIFFRELDTPRPDIELTAHGKNDAETVSAVITQLYETFGKIQPDVAVFLGDTNTVIGSLAAAMHNIPIVHIEGCMRSYDWRMPEEKYRTTIDHLSDVIYTYFDEYKEQGVREGINPNNIVVVGNPIVDILQRFYFDKKVEFDKKASDKFFAEHGVEKQKYYVMTSHRRENVHNPDSLKAILELAGQAPFPVYFPASYRTVQVIKDDGLSLSKNILVTEPIGYEELIMLMVNAKGVITDSGTVVEETCVLQIPSVQMRKSTERPQVYDAKSSVKFDPAEAKSYPPKLIFKKLAMVEGTSWKHNLGDGKTSKRIAMDLIMRVKSDTIRGHRREQYHLPTERSYREDDIEI